MEKRVLNNLLMVSLTAFILLLSCKKEELPSISTTEVSELGLLTATSGGNITADGNADITARGVCWADHENPVLADHFTSDGTGIGSFTSNLSGLVPGTKYYLRAYATNSKGTQYGEPVIFTTFSVVDFDKNLYHSVKIGTQEWLAENLKVTHFQNGDIIPNITADAEWSTLTSPGYCSYNNLSSNMNTYGGLYNFYTAKDIRNVCPAGWHVPVMDEWITLFSFLGNEFTADVRLREAGILHWTKETGADNSTGFTMLPGGNRESDGRFFNLQTRANVWSSLENVENGVYSGWLIGMEWDKSQIRSNPYGRSYGASIRCIKN